MPGEPSRDLAVLHPWEASYARSRARRERVDKRRGGAGEQSPPSLTALLGVRGQRGASARDLAATDPWELSLGRSRARRRARELRFVPAGTRAKRISLGALVALSAGPAAGLADASGPDSATTEPPTTTEHIIVLSEGDKGRQVELLQQALGIGVDGLFGSETEEAVQKFQAHHGLTIDGIVGPQTSAALRGRTPARASAADVSNGEASSPGEGSTGGAVARLQDALHLTADGNFGPETEAAIRRLQARHGLTVDGVVGPATWSVIGVSGGQTLKPPRSALCSSSAAGGGSSVVTRVIAAGDEIATRPYVFGGGHGSFQSTGYDCSGSVSYALHGGGLLSSPEDSSALESYGEPGPGRHITIYANSEHAWMVVDGKRFDTIAQQETGTRWSSTIMSTAGYVARHPEGM
jgi:peptidoglycan hydrolase-like protein with peptidoglycan-binding domain